LPADGRDYDSSCSYQIKANVVPFEDPSFLFCFISSFLQSTEKTI
jgi:hypothetical protein